MNPKELHYSAEHTWAKVEGDTALVGITDYAQNELGDVVFVELPEEGGQVKQGEPFGVIESVKAVSDLHAPVSGEIIEVNQQLEEAPETVNEDPYNQGWIIKVKLADTGELNNLLSTEKYEELLAQNS
jgi:glycine cleavage system H protein